MFRGDTSGSSSLHREKRQKIDFAKEEAPTLEKLVLTKLEQEQVKPTSLSLEKWQKLLEMDPVQEWFKSEQGSSWLNRFLGTEVGKEWFKLNGKQ